MRSFSFLSSVLVAAALASASVRAGNLSEYSIGRHISGPDVDLGELQGKVVVIECWGVNCPPCIAAMPHLAELHDRLSDDGLVLIGAERQNGSEEAIGEICRDADVEFTITDGVTGPDIGGGLPQTLVFDGEGRQIFNGRPGEDCYELIRDAVRDARRAGVASGDRLGARPAGTPVPEDAEESRRGVLVPSRTWTDNQGRSLEAALVRVTADGTGTFRRPNLSTFTFPIERLSETDRQVVEEAAK